MLFYSQSHHWRFFNGLVMVFLCPVTNFQLKLRRKSIPLESYYLSAKSMEADSWRNKCLLFKLPPCNGKLEHHPPLWVIRINFLCEMVFGSFEVPLNANAEWIAAAESLLKSIKKHTALPNQRAKHRSLEWGVGPRSFSFARSSSKHSPKSY